MTEYGHPNGIPAQAPQLGRKIDDFTKMRGIFQTPPQSLGWYPLHSQINEEWKAMLFRAGAAIATIVFLHGAGNLERDAGALVSEAKAGLPNAVTRSCAENRALCFDLATKAGTAMLPRESAPLVTASHAVQPLKAAPQQSYPEVSDAILPPKRKVRP